MPDSSFTYRHLFPHNPYPVPHPPPSIAHKVWILDCSSCSAFLTNRAMKAVLLLRPNVSLYSSDVLPANCSAYSSVPDPLLSQPSHKANPSHVPSRTCECLTQSLCCHTCGNAVGYMIVVPCTRCTSSVTATNRATNGHRFVFHSTEVSGTERHYVQGEPGVIPFAPAVFVPPPPSAPPQLSYPSQPFSPYPHYSQPPSRSRSSSPPVLRSDFLPTPPLEFATPEFALPRHYSAERDSFSHYPRSNASVLSPPLGAPLHYSFYSMPSASHSANEDLSDEGNSPSLSTPTHYPADQKEPPLPSHLLKPGSVLFWHHLARSGEIPGVTDDERARHPANPKASRELFFDR